MRSPVAKSNKIAKDSTLSALAYLTHRLFVNGVHVSHKHYGCGAFDKDIVVFAAYGVSEHL